MLSNLKSNTPRKNRKRLGRGMSSGWGKTSGKGHKGQNARSGGGVRPGFEGGQIPLFQRLPKRGFNSRNKEEVQVIALNKLEIFKDGLVVDLKELKKKGLIKTEKVKVKILNGTPFTKKLTIKANAFSKSALQAIEKAGSKAEVI